MHFDFSDDQKQMRDAARKFLVQEVLAEGGARSCSTARASYDKDLWKGLAEMGFLGVVIPEELAPRGPAIWSFA